MQVACKGEALAPTVPSFVVATAEVSKARGDEKRAAARQRWLFSVGRREHFAGQSVAEFDKAERHPVLAQRRSQPKAERRAAGYTVTATQRLHDVFELRCKLLQSFPFATADERLLETLGHCNAVFEMAPGRGGLRLRGSKCFSAILTQRFQ